jgi:hypothetical protein
MDVKTKYEADKRKDYDPIVTAHTELTDNLNDDLIRFQDEAYELGYKRGVFTFSDAFTKLEKAYRYQRAATQLRWWIDWYTGMHGVVCSDKQKACAKKAKEYNLKAADLFKEARATHGGKSDV